VRRGIGKKVNRRGPPGGRGAVESHQRVVRAGRKRFRGTDRRRPVDRRPDVAIPTTGTRPFTLFPWSFCAFSLRERRERRRFTRFELISKRASTRCGRNRIGFGCWSDTTLVLEYESASRCVRGFAGCVTVRSCYIVSIWHQCAATRNIRKRCCLPSFASNAGGRRGTPRGKGHRTWSHVNCRPCCFAGHDFEIFPHPRTFVRNVPAFAYLRQDAITPTEYRIAAIFDSVSTRNATAG